MLPIGYSEELINEFFLCETDPVYFINKYCKFQHPINGLVSINLYPYQIDLINAMHRGNIISIGPRQVGKTLISALFSLWLAIFWPSQNILIGTINVNNAQHIMSIIRIALKELPTWLIPKVNINTMQKLEFFNGSRIISNACSSDNFGRGIKVSYLIFDEFLFVRKSVQQYLLGNIGLTYDRGGSVAILSTMSDDDEIAKTLCDSSILEQCHIRWDEHPERGQEFKKNMMAVLGQKAWYREFEWDLDNGE